MSEKDELPEDYDVFNEKTRRLIVQKFAYLHSTNKIEVDTQKTVIVRAKEEAIAKENAELELMKPEYYKTMNDRAFWETRSVNFQRQLAGIAPSATSSKRVPDERFKDLLELEKRYTGEIKTPKNRRAYVEEKLYPLVMLLIREKRISGKFELPAFEDALLQAVNKRIDNLEDRVDNLDFGGQAPRNPQVPPN
jgi:hypothetical protein